jgi:hypothetical protein
MGGGGMLLHMQRNKFTVANFNFKIFTLKYSVQQFKIKTVTCHMFKGMLSHLSCAVKYQKIKFWSTVKQVKQCESHKYTNKKNTKVDLRLAGFGWVLSLFLRAGEEVLCIQKGQHGWFKGTTMAFAYSQNLRLVNKNCLRFKPGT